MKFVWRLLLALVLLLALGVVGTRFVLPRYVADAGKSDADWVREFKRDNKRELVAVAANIRRFERTTGRLPASLNEVPGVRETDGGPPRDMWGSEIRYETRSGGRFVLRAAGPDRAFDTSDDAVHDSDNPEDRALETAYEDLLRSVTPAAK